MAVSEIQHDTVALYRTLAQIDTGAKKEWAAMSLLEKLLKVITLGMYSPTLSLGEREEVKSIFSSIMPVEASERLLVDSSSMKEFACATFEDGMKLHCVADERQNVILYCSGALSKKCKNVLKLTEKQSQNFLDALPPMSYPLCGSQPLVHHSSEEGNMLTGVEGQLTRKNIRLTEQEALKKCTKRVEIDNLPPFSSIFLDFSRSLLSTEIDINGVVLTLDARKALFKWITENKTSFEAGTPLPPEIVEQIVSLCHVTDSVQKMSVNHVLSSSGGIAALGSLTLQGLFTTINSLSEEFKMTTNIVSIKQTINEENEELYGYGKISWPVEVIGEEPVSYHCVSSRFKYVSDPNPKSIMDLGLVHYKAEYNISAHGTLSAELKCLDLQRSAAVIF